MQCNYYEILDFFPFSCRHSRLPVPHDSTVSIPERKRIKSAPAKVASSTTAGESLMHASSSRPRPTPGQSHRKQVTKVSRTGTKLGGRGTQQASKDKQPTSAVKKSRGTSGRRMDATPVSNRQANNSNSLMASTSRTARMNSTIKAHQILVDQVSP